jgi:hypothetical protein
MDTAIIILAAGNWKGWYTGSGHEQLGAMFPGGYPKRHLLPVAGKPVIVRLVDQFVERGYMPTVVTDNAWMYEVISENWCFAPAEAKYWPSTFLSTRPLWQDRNYILQGDSVWLDEGIDAMLAGQNFPRVWAPKCGGVAAWAFLKENEAQVTAAMGAVIAAGEAGQNLAHAGDCYRALEGDQFRNYAPDEAKYWAQLPQGTYWDLDWPRHYLELLEANPWAAPS